MDCIEKFKKQACQYHYKHYFGVCMAYIDRMQIEHDMLKMIPMGLTKSDIRYCTRWIDDLLKVG